MIALRAADPSLGLQAGVAEAGGGDHDHARESGILGENRRAAVRAEAAAGGVAAVGPDVMILRGSGNLRGSFRERQERAVSRAAGPLAVATLAVTGHDRIGGHLVVDGAAGAAAGIGLA